MVRAFFMPGTGRAIDVGSHVREQAISGRPAVPLESRNVATSAIGCGGIGGVGTQHATESRRRWSTPEERHPAPVGARRAARRNHASAWPSASHDHRRVARPAIRRRDCSTRRLASRRTPCDVRSRSFASAHALTHASSRCRFTPLARTLRRRTRIYGRHREVRGVADAARDPGSKTRRGGGGDHRLAIGSEMHETTAGRGPGTHVRLAALASGNRSHAGDCNRRGSRTSRSDPAGAPVSMGAASGRTRSHRASQARASFPTSPAHGHAAAIG